MKNKRTTLFHSIIALLLCVSMLVGTTFAWFTDSVSTGINTIAAGVLDVELYHSNAAVKDQKVDSNTKLFMDLQGKPILWEPGVVSYENLRVTNEGDLALVYQLAINTANENYIVDPATGAQYGLSQILKVGVVEGGITATDRAGVVESVKDANWTTLANFLRSGSLLPEGAGTSEETWGVVIYWQPGDNDNLWNLNNGKQLNEGDVLSIDLGVKLIATQEMEESDSFNNEYDDNAKAEFFPGFQGGSAGAAVTPNDQGATTEEVAMGGGDVSAVIPVGVQVAEGTGTLTLSVKMKDSSEANVQLGESEEKRSLDVHIEGVAQGNTVPMLITLEHYLSTGINTGALRLYHVENGAPVAMTQVQNPVNHNEFSYDPATGNVILALASFSEVAVIADNNNTWNGTAATAFAGGTGTAADPYRITNADQLAYFRNEVDGGRTFAGEYVMLENNITLSNVNFDPIGWGYENSTWNRDGIAGRPFKGTFDGNGKTIFDLSQNGWDLEAEKPNDRDYTYTNCGFGLFAAASGATFKNLTISGANIRVECVEAGVLVGLSQNTCTYNNIKILNSKIANYQRPAGGLIGEVSGDGTTTIENVIIGDDVVVGSLWGDFDAPCGGVIGAYWNDVGANPQIYMTNVDVGCRLDVYNDITSAYQWHAYRRAGMLIGNTDMSDPNNAHKAYAPFLHCAEVRVYYGDWVNYHYCEFTNQDNTWARNYPWVRVEAGENCSAYSNPRYGQPVVGGVTVSTDDHTCTGEHHLVRQFSQLYGGGQGIYGQDKHDGVIYPDNAYSITYINDGKTLDIVYVTKNTEEYPVGSDQAKKLVDEWATENMKDYNGYTFGGWMTAASKKLTEIPQGNTQNIVLYPYFTSPYTASFVDVDSNVLAWCFFNEVNVDNLPATFAAAKQNRPNPGDNYELLYWVVRGTDTNGNTVNVQLADNNTNWESFKGYKDVTITPKYRYKGADLIEVYDELTGEIDHYQVAGYTGGVGSEIVEIPAYVNGKPVTTINADAFSSYDDLHSVRIPGTITEMNSQSFTKDNNPNNWSPDRDTVTLYYEGDPAVWNAAMEKYNNKDYSGMLKQSWDNAMGESSCVFFLDANGKVDLSKGYWELAEVDDPDSYLPWDMIFVWQYHNHEYGSNSGCSNEHNNTTDYYTGNCKCDIGTHERADKEYWN